jgi:hypothetical protein
MISRNALFTFIESLIEAAASDDALYEAVSSRNVRAQVTPVKIVRVDCFVGEHCLTEESHRKELLVKSVIECFARPASTKQADMDDAADISFDMSREIFEAIAESPSLGGAVCDAYFAEFETGTANFGSALHGVTYLDGMINQAS